MENVSPEIFKQAVEFYEADHALTQNDRKQLSDMFGNVAKTQLYGGWAGFLACFSGPWIHNYYKTRAVKGTKVNLGFVLGFLGMMVSTEVGGAYVFNNSLRRLQAESPNDPKTRCAEMLRHGQSSRWARYYHMTYVNPARAVGDPRDHKTQQKFIQQRDPFQLYSGPAFDEKEEQEEGPKTPMDKVRELNPDFKVEEVKSGDYYNSWAKIRKEQLNRAGQDQELNSWDSIRKDDIFNQSQDSNDVPTSSDFASALDKKKSEFDLMVENIKDDAANAESENAKWR